MRRLGHEAYLIQTHERGCDGCIYNSWCGNQPKYFSDTGPPILIYHHIVDAESEGDIEVCVPVSVSFSGGVGTVGRTLEAAKLAVTEHRGPYEMLAPAYQVLAAWITEKRYELAGPPREVYVTDPRAVATEELITRIEFPICTEGETQC